MIPGPGSQQRDRFQTIAFKHSARGSILMRVVVTGGSGFVGSHPLQIPVERGDSVVCVDNFSPRLSNIATLLDNPLSS